MLSLKELIENKKALPVIPEIATLLIKELNAEDPNFFKIEKLIYTDPIITFKLLKLVNSSYFGFTRKINNVADALNYIGYKKVLNLIITLSIATSYKHIKNINIPQFWQYSLNVAKLSSNLAEKIKIDKHTAFTIGLIHAIGELILHAGMSNDVEILNNLTSPFSPERSMTERELFGYSYLDVSSEFAQKSNFSNIIVETLSSQCSCKVQKDIKYRDMAIVLYLAIWRTRAKEANYNEKELKENFPIAVADLLNIRDIEFFCTDSIEWVCKEEMAMLI